MDNEKDLFLDTDSPDEPDTSAQLNEAATQLFDDMHRSAVGRAVQQWVDALSRILEHVAEVFKTLVDTVTVLMAPVPASWKHRALHNKKARVRKKYINRIREHLLKVFDDD